MANNSAVVMPLNQCCIEKIIQLPPSEDVAGNIRGCSKCNSLLLFNGRVWKEYF